MCYSAQAKRALLPGLPEKLAPTATEKHALQLAVALRELLEVDYAIGESGVAGPSKNSRGIAPGVDRIVMLLAEQENLREVVAFPMNQQAEDLLMQAPAPVSNAQLRELHIRPNLPKTTPADEPAKE